MSALIENNRETFVSACNKMLDTSYEILTQLNADTEFESEDNKEIIEDTKTSIAHYENVRRKLLDEEELSAFEQNMLAITCQGCATSMDVQTENLKKASKGLKELVKKLMKL